MFFFDDLMRQKDDIVTEQSSGKMIKIVSVHE